MELLAFTLILAVLAAASMRWGADSRDPGRLVR
jgi:hypothetical protein